MSEDTQDDNEVICPHCGYQHGDAWEWANNDYPQTMDCYGCDKSFRFWCERIITYHASADAPE